MRIYRKRGGGGNSPLLYLIGYAYNASELNAIFKTSNLSFFQLILYAYEQNKLEILLHHADGVFSLVLYDEDKIILANDRFGLKPLFIYTKAQNFAFANELKALLVLDFVDKSVDEKAFGMFMKFGHFLGSNTWFKYVKSLAPATLVEFNLHSKAITQKHYWTFGAVKKSEMSFENAVDRAYELFNEAIKKQVNLNFNPGVLLSGGGDSRLIVAAMNEIYPHYKPPTATFGVKNCLDFILAQKVCDIIGTKNHETIFDENLDWFNERKDFIYNFDCAHSMMHLHGCEFKDLFPSNSRVMVSGYLGDTIFGDSYLPPQNFQNKRANESFARLLYGEFAEFCEYKDSFFDIENTIPVQWLNRGKNFINMSVNVNLRQIVVRPFFDNKVVEFVASLPNEYFTNYKFYTHLALKHYPKFFKNLGRNSLKPLYTRKNLTYLLNKIKYKIDKKKRKFGFLPRVVESYTNYEKWINEEPVKSQIAEYLASKNAFYKAYQNELLTMVFLNKYRDFAEEILRLISVEIYFERMRKIL